VDLDLLKARLPERLSRRAVLVLGGAAGALGACGQGGAETATDATPSDPGDDVQVASADGCTPSDPTNARGIRPVNLTPEDRVLGSPDAPFTIIEYASITCPHCATFHQQTYPELKRRYIDTGKMRLVFRELPTAPANLAMAGFLMARCAPEDKYFDVLSLLFERQIPIIQAFQTGGPGARDELVRIARAVGVTEEQFDACIRDNDEIERITRVGDDANRAYGAMSTPAVIINGEAHFGAMPIDDFVDLIKPYVGVAC
jgi:protein-disulfide isomerase